MPDVTPEKRHPFDATPITGDEMVAMLTARCRCGHGKQRHVREKVESWTVCLDCGQHDFEEVTCPCPYEWKSYGTLYNVSMGKGWNRMADSPDCEEHRAD
jgi:hypothetical protein